MTTRILVATYDSEEGVLSGAAAARDEGITIVDAYTPYAVHGLDEAMGLKPSRLTWVCFLLGASAAVFMTWFQIWTSAVSWPVNIGGKPWNSLPAFAPVIFESMVLCAGLGTVAVLFLVSRLRPGKRPKLVADGVTNDRFALVVEHDDAKRDLDEMRELFQSSQPVMLEDRILDDAAPCCSLFARENSEVDEGKASWLGPANIVLLGLLLVLVAINLLGPRNLSRTNWEVFREMMRSPAPSALSASGVLPGGITQQQPVPNTIARGLLPLHYDPSERSAIDAGLELENPYQVDDQGLHKPGVMERGRHVFMTFCTACHGPTGGGDGEVARRGFPPPPAYAVGKSKDMRDGQIFHILTYGQGNMPPLAGMVGREDRWKVILYVRRLQADAAAQAAVTDIDTETASEDELDDATEGS